MAALRRPPLSSSPSKTEQSSSLPPKSILKKRKTRSTSPETDDSDYEDDSDSHRISKKKVVRYARHAASSSLHPYSSTSKSVKHHEQQPPPPSYRSTTSNKDKKRIIAKQENRYEDFKPIQIKHARFAAPATAVEPCRCKFAKAGCPFTGSHDDVTIHEDIYCSPLYRQLAHYKMLANRASSANSPHASTSKLPACPTTSSTLSVHDQSSPYSTYSIDRRCLSESASSPSKESLDSESVQSLKIQIQKLQTDLQRAQSQLEEERKLRTERLRKASERCLELMSLSELGEGKVEVLSMKLKAERELREKLEEELESVRAESIAQDLLSY